ncbi:F-box domain-containing protein [Coniochaeta sp. 2T2.1]|nr:F-box domain-containing protein [Coniochaeta sp. 2T2.1]
MHSCTFTRTSQLKRRRQKCRTLLRSRRDFCLSYPIPSYLLIFMIKITDPPNSPDLALVADRARIDRVSSLGILDRLPPEIMSIVLGMLDIQSVVRFARVSSPGNSCVQSHRAYRDLATFAPQVLSALGRVGLIGLHSVADLHAVLRTERCAACVEFGAFLFLPTGERCCWECLRYNPSFRMLLPNKAMRVFGLSQRHLERLPTLHVIPGGYGISADPAPENCRLVSVQAAKALGLEVHGSASKLTQAMARRCRSARLSVEGRFLQSEPVVASQGQDLLLLPSQGNLSNDEYFGMASIPFPSLSKSGRIEDGLWCRGCALTLRRYHLLPRDVLAAVVPANVEPQRVMIGLERRARSKEAFLNHVKSCYGARLLAPDIPTGNRWHWPIAVRRGD